MSLAGTILLGGDLRVHRLGFGAMRLTGRGIWGPPADRDTALAVLRRAVELGIDHIDTSDYYGPAVVNELIREALEPYPDELVIVTKVGARRTPDGGWVAALSGPELRRAVEDNLAHLALDQLPVVNLRIDPDALPLSGSIAEQVETLAALREQGLIRHVGLSNVSARQLAEARDIVPIVCVQNEYNLAHREDDALIDTCATAGIAYVPFFPLGGFSPLGSEQLTRVAEQVGATPMQTALAWLLARSPNILCIPGTSTVDHLEQNVAAADLSLTDEHRAALTAIG